MGKPESPKQSQGQTPNGLTARGKGKEERKAQHQEPANKKAQKGKTSKEQEKWLEQLGLCTELEVHLWRPSNWDEIEERLGFIPQGTSPY